MLTKNVYNQVSVNLYLVKRHFYSGFAEKQKAALY